VVTDKSITTSNDTLLERVSSYIHLVKWMDERLAFDGSYW